MKTPASRTPIYKHPALYVALFVVFSWALYGYLSRHLDYQTLGQWGDSFGYINSLFTGLALAGIVAAYWHEREQAECRDAEHREVLDAMRIQADAAKETTDALRDQLKASMEVMKVMRAQVTALNHSTKFHAKVHRLDRCLARLREIARHGPDNGIREERERLRSEIASLQGDLDRFSDTDP